jgi:hypothetical protein
MVTKPLYYFTLSLMPQDLTAPQPPTQDVFQRTDERALINLVPRVVQEHFIEAQKACPELFSMDEMDLFKELRRLGKGPTPTDNRLRLSFWLEYDRAQSLQEKMNMAYVYAGVCLPHYFHNSYLNHPTRVAWLLCPPVEYQRTLEEGVAFGAQKMREFLALDPIDPYGKPNLKLMELQAKIFAMLDQRLKGGYTQKIESKTLAITGSLTEKQAMQAITDNSMEAMERRLKELEKRERKALNMPEVIVVNDAGKS